MSLGAILRTIVTTRFTIYGNGIEITVGRNRDVGLCFIALHQNEAINHAYWWPDRAQSMVIEDVKIVAWGRDTFVHQNPEAS